MTKYFIDTSSYQPFSLAYFQSMKAHGARGAVIKTSQGGIGGTPYVNPRGKYQVANAKKAGLRVSLYHYGTFNSLKYGIGDPASEAKLMAQCAEAWGCDKDTLMVLDAEDHSLRQAVSADAALFFNELKRYGFHNFDIYGPGSWFWAGRLKIGTSYKLGGWPASYGTSSSGVAGAKAWQFTDSWKGLGVDGSLDYGGQYTGGSNSSSSLSFSSNWKAKKLPAITKDNRDDYYYTYNPKMVIVDHTIYQHKTHDLTSKKNRKRKLKAGTLVDIASVEFVGLIPVFKLANGTYITAQHQFVSNMYYELPNLKQVKVKKATYLYKDLKRKQIVRRSHMKFNKWPKGTYFDIEKVIHLGNSWVLKTTSGYFLTANKQYVKKTK